MAQTETRQQVLVRLEGRACAFCDDGTLERSEYNGNEAVVCDECGTPAAQSWSV